MKILYIHRPKIPSKILQSFRHWASFNLDIDQPSIVKTFTNVHDINFRENYYEEKKIPDICKYMKEFIDVKHLNSEFNDHTYSNKYKHKKTNRTPKMIRKSNRIIQPKCNLVRTNSNSTNDSNDIDTINTNAALIIQNAWRKRKK
jgi:hypothetical protein